MVEARVLWGLLPRHLRELPVDLAAAVVGVLLVNIAVFAPVIRDTPLRVPLGLAFVLFIPGYALIAALFPEEGESPIVDEDEFDADDDGWLAWRQRSGIDGIERVALSFGLSIAIVPLIGLVLNFTPWGVRLVPIMVATSGFTLAMIATAAHRRWELPPDERFRVPYRDWIEAGRAEVFEPHDQFDAALNVALALSVLLAVGVMGFVIMFPSQGEQFSEFYILTEDDDGDLVAAHYPETFTIGEPNDDIVLGIANKEHETVEYTVIVQLQHVAVVTDQGGNATDTEVTDAIEIDRFQVTLAHNESHHTVMSLEVTDSEFVGENRRLQFLLYADHDGGVPSSPTRENAYRDLHLWVNVEAE